jgi:hypothetical protein
LYGLEGEALADEIDRIKEEQAQKQAQQPAKPEITVPTIEEKLKELSANKQLP